MALPVAQETSLSEVLPHPQNTYVWDQTPHSVLSLEQPRFLLVSVLSQAHCQASVTTTCSVSQPTNPNPKPTGPLPLPVRPSQPQPCFPPFNLFSCSCHGLQSPCSTTCDSSPPANKRAPCFDTEGFTDITLLSLLPVRGSLNTPASPGKSWFVCGVPPLLVSLLLICASCYLSLFSESQSQDRFYQSKCSFKYHFFQEAFLHLPPETTHISFSTCSSQGLQLMCASWKKCQFPSYIQLFAIPWTVACQAPLPMGFSRQEYWSGLPCPPPGNPPNPRTEPGSPVLQADYLPSWATREDTCVLLGK